MRKRRSAANQIALRRAKRRDRIARYVITLGGIAIIATVVGMLLLILRVAAPLFFPASAELIFAETQETGTTVGVGVDEFLEDAYEIDKSGALRFVSLDGEKAVETVTIEKPVGASEVVFAEAWGNNRHNLLWNTGDLSVVAVSFTQEYDAEGRRSVARRVSTERELPAPENGPPIRSVARTGENSVTRVDLLELARLRVTREATTESLLGDAETVSTTSMLENPGRGSFTALALDSNGETLYAGTSEGYLIRWRLTLTPPPQDGEPELLDHVRASETAVTALGVVFGDVSIAVGDSAGNISTWFPTAAAGSDGKALRRIHELPSHAAAIASIMPSRRNKSFLTLDDDGVVHLNHMTTERRLTTLASDSPIRSIGLASRGNAVAAGHADGGISVWRVESPHPEVSFRTLAGRVWYENYPAPDFVWQSSAANDDFEPKFSLVPLVFGSFKGTVYAMCFALPLSLLGAIYVSQFTTPAFRGTIKPAIEIMAAVPSVVIGFLIALWLAPVVERFVVGFFLSLVLIPLFFAVFLCAWRFVADSGFGRRVSRGYEFLLMIPVMLLAIYAARLLAPAAERLFFEGNFAQWLFSNTGQRYDQRNAMIIAFGLGFAVIPIIFTIAEDSLSNVPNVLKAGSLALGASRWQTVWRVVLPSASPGIFAAIIIGFGRAVGETMIVLMATGNTPILDLSPFNGMRTLSANIAVEIPEAPENGTLFRILFLSAVILFVMTSVLNTAAELIRQRLRKRYGQY